MEGGGGRRCNRHRGAGLGEVSVGDGPLCRVKTATGDAGVSGEITVGRRMQVEEAESISPRKKYQAAKGSSGMPSALTPTCLTNALI